MEGFLGGAYPWVKAFHIIAVIAWMAGMLYLPRLFAYHVDAAPGSQQSETFKVMERRLLRGIINPAMILVFLLGGMLFLDRGAGIWTEGWWHVKLGAVLVLSGLHGWLSRWRRAFAEDRNTKSARFYKIVNEVPAVLMVIIVIMVVVKPF
ncbi:MAG: protoporphyrinogen oxidase HemJ [Alphaproteobacteria bacterium]|jgi:putative membrane protein|nr:protoporphyrinogen oxidase HemJ [Rhodospirillaceae bacterium]MDG2479866.1 protoporphyrinogen oxidase HemJ [Alphaproteobacteria bacterium]MBT6202806.1 protoporphyrinogen oxidase HemJ [Rhodospirillaceae bacterium]MBT6509047.1 protoporphyrinogen oxidase HemJ [Rhodospirillaceae bacterium]MBT7613618.1 protoporphyrinogen oxidase HemJ [Rhodospirillaceae bacterium]